jgi:uncharacterized protein YjiS (DUF1127 family)
MREEAMFAVNQDKANESPGLALKDLCAALLAQRAVLDDRFGVCRIFRWLRDEARRNAMMRELNLLDDHCLDDLGFRRPFDQRNDDLVKRLRAGG